MSIRVADLPPILEEIIVRVRQDAAPMAARAMAEQFQVNVKARLGAMGHFLHTKTPSPPGNPPAWISRNLLGSVDIGPFAYGGDGAAWECHSALVYSAIQEFGGDMTAHSDRGMRWQEPPGVWHRSMAHSLPERSYFGSTTDIMLADGQFEEAAVRGFLAADIFAGLG